jgi:hypothetical protein
MQAMKRTKNAPTSYAVYLLSLRNKGRVVAKGKLVTNNATQEFGGVILGKEYFGVYVEGLENVDSRNKGDELIPRHMFEIRTLTDAIVYIIPWPRSHVSFFKDSTCVCKLCFI